MRKERLRLSKTHLFISLLQKRGEEKERGVSTPLGLYSVRFGLTAFCLEIILYDMHPLDGPQHKVDWAYKRLVELEVMLSSINTVTFPQSTPQTYSVVGELDTTKKEYIYRVHIVNEACILDIKVLLGETVYLLRSALDNLAWQLALLNVGKPSRRTEFPIYRKQPNNTKTRREYYEKVREIHPNAQNIIEKLQPYQRGSAADSDPLALLDELCNTDKHRGLNPVAISQGVPILPNITVECEGVDEGNIIARVPAFLNPEATFKPFVFFQVVLPIRGPTRDRDIAVLRGIHEYIRDTVLPSFMSFFS